MQDFVRLKRIEKMEECFVRLLADTREKSEEFVTLKDYMDSGLWLSDYEADERGELPPELKRGVLSQDGLYNLLCDLEQPNYHMETERLGFSNWKPGDTELARQLWGDPAVTRYICASGIFSEEDIASRLNKELENEGKYSVQYWPIFELKSGELAGCCGLRPYSQGVYELGFHLRPAFWHGGYGYEAARAAIAYAFDVLHAEGIFAGHHPSNEASRRLLLRLGFEYKGDEFYEPTGLFHPSYEMRRCTLK